MSGSTRTRPTLSTWLSDLDSSLAVAGPGPGQTPDEEDPGRGGVRGGACQKSNMERRADRLGLEKISFEVRCTILDKKGADE